MGKVPNSFATIDSGMLFKTEDDSLRKFFGQENKDMFTSFINCIHPDDKDIFRGALEELKAKAMPKNIVMIRLISRDNDYCWAVITLSYKFHVPGGEEIFYLHIVDPDDDTELRLKDSKNEYSVFLDMMSGILFSYEVDTKQLSIFILNGGQQLSLFSGPLENWKENVLDGKLDKEYEASFLGFCRDLEMKRTSFSYSIRTSSFSNDNKMEQCTFKAQLISGHGGEKILGCITSIENQTTEHSNFEYTRDIGMPVLNKKSITDYAKRAMTASGNKVCLVILDLDNFKVVNDTLGHMVGDEVLIRTAEIIKAALGDLGVLGRIGGDEMMIVFPRVESETELRNTMRTIRTNIEWEYKNKYENVQVTCSMGAAVYPDNGGSYDEIFSLADKMLYIAKSKGKNRYVIYVPEIHGTILNPEQKSTGSVIKKVQENKNGVMQQLVEQFLVRHTMTYEQMISSVGNCFNLDEIVLVYGERLANSSISIWNHDGYNSGVSDSAYSSPEPEFMENFDDNNMLVINAISGLESKTKVLYNKLKENGVESVLFYKFSETSKYKGYMVFSKSSRRQMWSEQDKILLATVGKIVELSLL
ncbi:MAG: GGDEF domain-containing protein [Lachnospiraceae bacterium]|nr:GGDEF domain-containing protein [Lachnospiraceae bacterium]